MNPDRRKKKVARKLEEGTPSPAPLTPPPTSTIDARPEVTALFANLKASKKNLNSLLMKCSAEWTYFDPVYRFYHQSFKVFGPQRATLELVAALQALAPDANLIEPADQFRVSSRACTRMAGASARSTHLPTFLALMVRSSRRPRRRALV